MLCRDKPMSAPGAAAEAGAGSRPRSPGMARMVAPGTDIDRVIQRVITRSAALLQVAPRGQRQGWLQVHRVLLAAIVGY